MNSPLVASVNGLLFAGDGWLNPHGSVDAGSANKHAAARPTGRGKNLRGGRTRGVSGTDFPATKRLLRIFRNFQIPRAPAAWVVDQCRMEN
ncbi:hypothetical protein GCM10009434_08500 [Brevundimonas olei]